MPELEAEQILEELVKLWSALGETAEQSDSHGVLRACALTLVVVAEEAEAAAAGETLAELMHGHPHRAILVRVRRNSPPLVEHRVLAQCWMPFGQRQQICCEQIEITAAEKSLPELVPLIAALRAPDLPLVLWLRGAGLFPSLAPLAPDKVIVDSGAATDAAEMLGRLAGNLDGGPALGDLSWARLTPWRQRIAQAFDAPASRALLPQVSEIVVSYTGTRIPPEAWYLGGWVLSTLGRGSGVRFEAAKNETLAFPGAGIAPVPNGLRHRPETERVGEELAILGRDPVYDRALKVAARLAEQG
jgi:glucose-6-phosphate dehydrogenase assembly protein OpcA